MPKLGMEPLRRAALTQATIAEIGARGSIDVTVGQIARRAGMSTALAHHYFGGKDQILLAAMRQILRDLRSEVLVHLAAAPAPDQRAAAIIKASFAPEFFTRSAVGAWMAFYAHAQTDAGTLHLLKLYQARLQSNLCHALRGLSEQPEKDAATLGALIDGLYLRAALVRSATPGDALACALGALDTLIGHSR